MLSLSPGVRDFLFGKQSVPLLGHVLLVVEDVSFSVAFPSGRLFLFVLFLPVGSVSPVLGKELVLEAVPCSCFAGIAFLGSGDPFLATCCASRLGLCLFLYKREVEISFPAVTKWGMPFRSRLM